MKAQENISLILSKCCEIVNDTLESITKQYQEMYNMSTSVPKNEKQLIDLKVFVQEKDIILSKLSFEVKSINRYLLLFEEYFYTYDTKMLEKYFYLLQWPEGIRSSIKGGAKHMSLQESRFMENLVAEKEVFQKVYYKINETYTKVKSFDSYESTKENVFEVSALMELFETSIQQVISFNDRE